MAGGPLHIVDEIEFEPGQRTAFLAALEKRYRPQAQALGLSLHSLLLEPPVEGGGCGEPRVDRLGARERRVVLELARARSRESGPRGVLVRRRAADRAARAALCGVRSLESAALEPAASAPTRRRAAQGRSDAIGLSARAPRRSRGRRARGARTGARIRAGRFVREPGPQPAGTLFGGDYTWDLAGASAAVAARSTRAPLRARSPRADEIALEPIAGGLRAPA
jgi:hypothetical protein